MKMKVAFLSVVSVSSALAEAKATAQPEFDMNQLHSEMLSLGDQTSECFNIGGTWKGTCQIKSSGGNASQTVVQNETEMTFVQKGCALIQAEQFGSSYLGAVKSETVSNSRGVLSQTGASYWSANGKKLGMDQSYSLVMYGEQGSVSVGKAHGSFSLQDDLLIGKVTQDVSRMNMKGVNVGHIKSESDCRLARQ